MLQRSAAALVPLLLSSTLFAQAHPLRQVSGDTLTSLADPAVTFVFDTAFHSAGGQTIDILHVAGAEQFFFIDAAPDRSIRRFYWIQFEHYNPDNTYTYNYSGIRGQQPMSLGQFALMGDVRLIPHYFTDDDRPGSDSRAAADFLTAQGYQIDGTFVSLRMFCRPDRTKRKELMIIYGEVVSPKASGAQLQLDIAGNAQANVKVLPDK